MKEIRIKILNTIVITGLLTSPLAFADAPVYNMGNNMDVTTSTQNGLEQANQTSTPSQYSLSGQPPLTLEQRIAKLERQMAFQNRQNLLTQINNLQQEIQDLRGQIEVQAYDLRKVRQQQDAMYKDLDQRVGTHASAHQAINESQGKPITSNHLKSTVKQKTTTNSHAAVKAISSMHNNQTVSPASQAERVTKQIQPTNNSFLSDQNAYEAAYNLIKDKQFDDAVRSMQNYLAQHPDGRYAANAHYWLGELLLLQNESAKAISELQTVIDHYPMSSKVGDAMLKLGLIYYDNGQLQKAKEKLTNVEKQFPGTSAAQLAATRLQDIKEQLATN